MFEVTEKATEKVKEFFKSRDGISPLRVFVAGAGCSGPQLGMALDEPGENDETFEADGFMVLGQPALKLIKDIMEMGGKVDKLGVEILLDGHRLYEVQKIVLEFGDLV